MDLIFVTGNMQKLEQAKDALRNFDIQITNQKIETPEIQEVDIKNVAEYSAEYAANKLQKPVVVTDVGYYIEALNGFPGPFIKFINQWLKPEDLLKLMEGTRNRTISSPICVSYCEPDKKPVSFISENEGFISTRAQGEGSTIDQLYIPKGYNSTLGTMSSNKRLAVWNIDCWTKLANYLTKKEKTSASNKGT